MEAFRSTQAPPQLVCPAAQFSEHTPFEHTEPAAQAWLQAPQCRGELCTSTHAPPQFRSGAAHAVWHIPSTQTA